MNNEPVAWMYQDDESRSVTFYRDTLPCGAIPLYTHPVKELDCYGDGNVYRGVRSKDSEVQTIFFNPVKELNEPNWKEMYWWMHELNHKHWSELSELKAHPVKELTDEEILQQAEWIFGTYFFESIDDPYWIEFARAILRKAQEK